MFDITDPLCYPNVMDGILDIIKRNNFAMKKKFGQNFVTDGNLLSAIADDAKISKDDTVLEIGAGAGTLTRVLAKRALGVCTFEIDESLKPILDESLADSDNVKVIFADILKVDKKDLPRLLGIEEGRKFKVVANLPYYITSPVLFYFLEGDLNVSSITVMVQKEVAQRMVALPNTPDYGVLSLAVQSRGEVSLTRNVSRKLFFPEPNVDSAVVRIDLRDGLKNREMFDKVVRCAFAMRRKTLANNLMQSFGFPREKAEGLISSMGLDVKIRGEALSLDQFVQLADMIKI